MQQQSKPNQHNPQRTQRPKADKGNCWFTCPACQAAAVAGDRVTAVRVAAVTTLAAVQAICSILQEEK